MATSVQDSTTAELKNSSLITDSFNSMDVVANTCGLAERLEGVDAVKGDV